MTELCSIYEILKLRNTFAHFFFFFTLKLLPLTEGLDLAVLSWFKLPAPH